MMTKSFTCHACGKEERFGVYVAAHWNEPLTFTCDCGAKSLILRGTAKPIKPRKIKKGK